MGIVSPCLAHREHSKKNGHSFPPQGHLQKRVKQFTHVITSSHANTVPVPVGPINMSWKGGAESHESQIYMNSVPLRVTVIQRGEPSSVLGSHVGVHGPGCNAVRCVGRAQRTDLSPSPLPLTVHCPLSWSVHGSRR